MCGGGFLRFGEFKSEWGLEIIGMLKVNGVLEKIGVLEVMRVLEEMRMFELMGVGVDESLEGIFLGVMGVFEVM